MKVVENTSDRLFLRDAPWFMSSLLTGAIVLMCYVTWQRYLEVGFQQAALMGVFAIGLPALGFVLLVRRDELILDRATGVMEIRHTTLFGYQREEEPLDRLEQASTQTHHTSNGNTRHRVALILSGDPKKDIRNISPAYGAGPHSKDAADIINRWLKEGVS
ncbi:hypothetical protein [Pseudaestuariivita rosea]|uniref:hypothetical protein n=1 Tax=Pseudaestuariivita rosea TaxID=2763263 RepID=UPI001ABBA625|nr:hypothetical protein [Pseudaestuariivita rosea]